MFGQKRITLVRAIPGLLFSLLFATGCRSDFEFFKVKPVRAFRPLEGARVGVDLAAVPDRISLKEQRDFAFWVSKEGTTLKVDFNKNGTPFAAGQPFCQENFCSAGPPLAGSARPEAYKYRICANEKCKDPEVMIKN